MATAENMQRGTETMESDGPITSVPRLLAPHDLEFIQTAYQAVLGRAPDPEGEAYYLARLRTGTHKLEILKQLRNSAEGRAFIPGVAGLDRAIKRHFWATMLLVGAVVRLLTGAEGNSATQQQLRILVNEMGCLRGEQLRLLLAGSLPGAACQPSLFEACTKQSVPPANAPLPFNYDALPPLAATLGALGPAQGFDSFLFGLQGAVSASREAAIMRQR